MTRERNVVLGSIVLWGVLLFLFGGVVAFNEVVPYPETVVHWFEPGYEAYQDAAQAAMVSSFTYLFSLVVSIIALYKIIKGVSKWYVMGDRQSQPVEPYTIDL